MLLKNTDVAFVIVCRMSWFVFYTGFNVVLTLGISAFALNVLMSIKISFNNFVLIVLFFLYGMSMVCLTFAALPLFTRTKLASNLVPMLTIASSFIGMAVLYSRNGWNEEGPLYDVPAYCQCLLCLFCPVALVLGIERVGARVL